MDQHSSRSLPNKAVDVIAYQTFSRSIAFRVLNSLLPGLGFRSPYRVAFRLRGRLLYVYVRRGCGIAQRLIDLATHPEPMQQDR